MQSVLGMLRIVTASLLMMAAQTLAAQSHGIVSKAEAGRDGDSARVFLSLNPEMLTVADDEVLTISPRLATATDSLTLPAIHILGRNTYYRYLRHDDLGIIMPADYVVWTKRRYRPFAYGETAGWQPWMDAASLKVQIELTDCGQTDIVSDATLQEARRQELRPTASVRMVPGVITNSVTIIFPLNRTEVRPDLYQNCQELDKIRQDLATVTADPNAQLQGITIKGFASPEGPYANNVRLARGRTDSIGAFVARNYRVDSTKVHTDYEAEDWQGLIAFMEAATPDVLPHRQELLAIARRTDLLPDQRERLMRSQYPRDFQYLLQHCLPRLRHTDYRIDYLRRTPVVETAGHGQVVSTMPPALRHEAPIYQSPRPYDALLALKTNVLFDAVLALNGEIEVPIGRNNRWSVMGEFWKPWFVWHRNSRAYQLQVLGGEVRYWLGACRQRKAKLTGLFVGPYYAWGKYDFEWGSTGDQGEFHSIGVTAGYVWPIHRRWNLELSASIGTLGGGWLGGERRHYHGEFDDSHLIWQYTTTQSYTGPTKLKVSLAWLIGRQCRDGRKEARR